jgi:hypothetical protein
VKRELYTYLEKAKKENTLHHPTRRGGGQDFTLPGESNTKKNIDQEENKKRCTDPLINSTQLYST